MNESEDLPAVELNRLIEIFVLHARMEALTLSVQSLARAVGVDPEKFHHQMKVNFETVFQLHLEKTEAMSPRLAAMLVKNFELTCVDQNLLDRLRNQQ